MSSTGQAARRSTPGDLLAQALAPGGLSMTFRPVMNLRPKAPMLHSVECVPRGPLGSPLEDSLLLQACARERGVEVLLDRGSLRVALPAAAELPEAPRFALPVHASTLAGDPRYPELLIDEARFWGLAPRRLIVDVLQPQDLGPAVLEGIDKLRAAGFLIAIDGVGGPGTDYEGLLACRPDFVKVERAAGHEQRGDAETALLFDLLLRQARGIGSRPLAKGVESLADLEDAVELGIQLVEGRFFGAAMDAAELRSSGLLRKDEALPRDGRG